MKKLLEKISKTILITLVRFQVRKYKPLIIGITGNAGKTSTREAIASVVRSQKTVRAAAGSLNNELGFALTILGNWDDEYFGRGSSIGLWVRVFFVGVRGLISRRDFPQTFILEYGADHPGDIKRLAHALKPHISVVTTVGDVPVHIKYFQSTEAMADEKANLVKVLSTGDYAILNHDDHRVLAMKSKTKAKVLTYGFDQGSTIRASDVEYTSNEEGRPLGVTFKLNEGSRFAPIRIEGSLGKSQAWSAAAATAVGSVLGMNLVDISEALSAYHGPKGRLKILRGIKNSNIIDDTYNASPASTRLALETLRDVPALRKIAVLGDMLELGEHSEKAHRDIGVLASEVADVIVCVGPQTKAIAQSASGKLSSDKIFIFDNSNGAKSKVQELIHEHDLVLVKGSQGLRMERIVAEIMADSSQAKDLIVRQSQRWLSK